MIVLIVTPTRNVESFLNETIFSVVSQIGDFDLYYHIQDSLSSDSTIEIIKKWQKILENPEGKIFSSRIYFSWASESDQGIYDAINRGFSKLLRQVDGYNPNDVLMGWINGDDILTHGSLQTVASFFSETDYRWATGVPSLIRHDSVIMEIRDSPCCFARPFLIRGLYEGRKLQFVQQEGTFWRQSLWEATGPLDTSLKLAGDWDLWRRFAHHSELITLKAVLGLHRRRQGQLSSSLEAYHKEVDKVLRKQDLNAEYAESFHDVNGQYSALTARWNRELSQWQIDRYSVLDPTKKLDQGDLEFFSDSGEQDVFLVHNELREKLSSSLQLLKFKLNKLDLDIIVSHCEVNDQQEIGMLLKRIFPNSKDILSVRLKNSYNGQQDFGGFHICLDEASNRKQIFESVSELCSLSKSKRIFSVPLFSQDIVLTLALKERFDIPLCTYLVQDPSVYENGESNDDMRELLEKSSLILGISKEICQAYNEKYNCRVWLLPPVVNPSLIQTNPDFDVIEKPPTGVLIGNGVSRKWLNQLMPLVQSNTTKIEWYGISSGESLVFDKEELERHNIYFKEFYSEEQLIVHLRRSTFGLILTTAADNWKEYPEPMMLSWLHQLTFLLAAANIPVLVVGSRETEAAKFVEEFQVGLVCGYTPESFSQAVSSICSPSLQSTMRQNASKLASLFSAENVDEWIWRSLEKGKPINFKFEELGKTLSKASAVITRVEINQLHGTGPLVKRIVEGTSDILSIRSTNQYGGEHDFGDLSLLISHKGLSRQEAAQNVISSLGQNTVSQILCVPYHSDDLITAVTLAESQNSPLGTYIMDDQNICVNNIPDSLMREFLTKCSLRLATHPELRDAYQDKYDLDVWLLPAVVPHSLILETPQLFEANDARYESGILVGSLWSNKWLDMLGIALNDAGVKLDWFGNPRVGGKLPNLQNLKAQGIKPCGLVSEIELVEKLRHAPFVIVPTGTMDDKDDRVDLSRLSLPGRIIFVLATSNTPVIILGHRDSPAARFVEKFQIGVTCGYDGRSLKKAIELVAEPEIQNRLRQNAASVASHFSSENINEWLWQSIQLGHPFDMRFEKLFFGRSS